MFLKHDQIAPDLAARMLQAAEAAALAIPPAFPLDATVAVNPFLGQVGQDLTQAAARLSRVSGAALTQPRAALVARVQAGQITDEDLADALIASRAPVRPRDLAWVKARMEAPAPQLQALPTVADLVARETSIDWPGVIARSFGLWAAGHFDRGQALWTPRPGRGAFAAWREWATHDLTPEIAGLSGFCAHVAQAPDTADRALLRAAERLGLTPEAAETAFHRLLVDLGGWAQHARWVLWQAQMHGGTDAALTDLLAIRLIWEEALLDAFPAVAEPWARTVTDHERPLMPTPDQALDAVLQEAAERAHQRDLAALLSGPAPAYGRPRLQAAFCIDVRSEPLRRALEAAGEGIQTLGFAGFFGLPVAHLSPGTDTPDAHLPVLLNPGLTATSRPAPEADAALRIGARARRAWGRFRQAAVSSFAFVEAAGPAYGAKLVKDALALGHAPAAAQPPRFDPPLPAEAKAKTAATVLRAMGLVQDIAPLVLLVGHGAHLTNNAHASAYQCGACGGQSGAVSARLLADLLNDPETRAGLAGQGMALPQDTVFVAGLHDTVTDEITLYPPAGPVPGLEQAEAWLRTASHTARIARAPRLPDATAASLSRRALDWAEVRPEWGLAGCAAFIAAPRSVTAGRDLQGRAFLHSYDAAQDPGFAVLELILTAPLVVASWISLQYYGSTVAPAVFGGGNKLIHNAVGGIGVVEGNGGRLRAGLPWQAVHDGTSPVHEALRLTVLVQAPTEAMSAILSLHPGVKALFDNGWLHLIALDEGRMTARYRPGLTWEPIAA